MRQYWEGWQRKRWCDGKGAGEDNREDCSSREGNKGNRVALTVVISYSNTLVVRKLEF